MTVSPKNGCVQVQPLPPLFFWPCSKWGKGSIRAVWAGRIKPTQENEYSENCRCLPAKEILPRDNQGKACNYVRFFFGFTCKQFRSVNFFSSARQLLHEPLAPGQRIFQSLVHCQVRHTVCWDFLCLCWQTAFNRSWLRNSSKVRHGLGIWAFFKYDSVGKVEPSEEAWLGSSKGTKIFSFRRRFGNNVMRNLVFRKWNSCLSCTLRRQSSLPGTVACEKYL